MIYTTRNCINCTGLELVKVAALLATGIFLLASG